MSITSEESVKNKTPSIAESCQLKFYNIYIFPFNSSFHVYSEALSLFKQINIQNYIYVSMILAEKD